MAEAKPLTPERIMQLSWGFAVPLTLEAAVRHGVFDALDSGPRTVDELAAATKASHPRLRAILNALVAFELLAKDEARYRLTPESAAFLVSHKPGYQGAFLRQMSSQIVPKWLKLSESVASGKAVFSVNEEGEGSEFFGELVESIAPMSAPAAGVLAEHLFADLKAPASVLDIAAGSGIWGIVMAKKSPLITVTAVDWPGVIPVTRRFTQKHGVADRFTFVEGDLDSANFGTGHRLATLGHILHSEGERRSRALLKKIFSALAPGGTIAIAEFVPDEGRSGPPSALIFAINMLINSDEGDTFTYSEMSAWLSEAGFSNMRRLQSPGPSPLILADKR